MNQWQAIQRAIIALEVLARDLRRPNAKEANERIARRIEAIAQKLYEETKQ